MLSECKKCKREFVWKVDKRVNRLHSPTVCSDKCFKNVMYRANRKHLDLSESSVAFPRKDPYLMRSSYEVGFAMWMNNNNLKWIYEPWSYVLSNKKRYVPDFFIKNYEVLVEIKGIWEPGSYSKFKRFKEEYPEIATMIFLVDRCLLKTIRCRIPYKEYYERYT